MSIAIHLPALQVVVPLIGAPLSVLLRRGDAAFAIVTAAAWAALAAALALWAQVSGGDTISYAIGSWPPPWGIEYRVDRLTAFMLVLVSGMAVATLAYSRESVAREVPRSSTETREELLGRVQATLDELRAETTC